MQLPHAGSWSVGGIKLPDLGITERVSDLFGQGRTATGGSNLKGSINDTVLVRDPNSGNFTQAAQPIRRTAISDKIGGDTGGTGGTPQPQPDGGDGGGAGRSVEDEINSQYNSISGELDRIINWLPEWQRDLETKIGGLAESSKSNVETARSAELSKFPGYRDNVETNQKKTLSDLAANIRNVMKAGNVYLGSKGAGDSSATGMFGFAASQEASKQRGDIRMQTDSMMKEIDMKESDVNIAYDAQLKAVDDWKMEEIMKVSDDFNNKKMSLMSQKPNIRAQAVSTWLNYLTTIDTQARSWQADIDKWAKDRLATLDNFKVQISQSSAFSPKDIVYDEMRFSPNAGAVETAPTANPWLISKKKVLGDES